jgi:hypothetical protein
MNAGTTGGNIYCESCTMSFTSTIFHDSVAHDGSVIYMLDTSSLTLTSVSMTDGKAIGNGGAIYSGGAGASSITITNCASDINYYQAGNDGGLFYISNSQTILTSSNCNYNDLYAVNQGGLVYGAELSTFDMGTCNIMNITSGGDGSMFTSTSSTLTFKISQCDISCLPTYDATQVNSAISSLTPSIGGLINIFNAVSVTSSNNIFKNCYTANTGSIFSLTSTTFTDTNS